MGESGGSVPTIGIVEWFHLNDLDHVDRAVKHLNILGVKDLRTVVSWAEYYTSEGENWYDWLIPHLVEHFNILPCFLSTPPSLGIVPETSSPPRDPEYFADFVDLFLTRHGKHFEYVELWNEPNNVSEYDYTLDESWDIFSMMITEAALCAKHHHKKTVLGGISPIDPGWIKKMGEKKVLDFIDVVGIHGFPDVFDSRWRSWEESIESVRNALNFYSSDAEIWITETGYSTWRYDERKQVEKFINVLKTSVNKVYWSSLSNIPFHSNDNGQHLDERVYHFGMMHDDNRPKLLYQLWSSGGIKNIIRNQWMTFSVYNEAKNKDLPVLITGGAGFIGTNLAHRLLNLGHSVYIYDNLSRPGVENNLKWLKKQHGNNLNIIIADIRDKFLLQETVRQVSHVFHLAAQVAVTTSLENPAYDSSVNTMGTLNLLEAIRKSDHKPSLIFTSTNKVYGDLSDINVRKDTTRYLPGNSRINKHGISELRRLEFHSPYGNSKGAADQYVLDYARSFGLRNVVFRMSCIYGEHQFGNEDQGWVAHFILKALKNEKITLFGDGMQVRDILFVDDLVDAFLLSWKNIEEFRGEVFNMGGGPGNSISLLELIDLLENIMGREVSIEFEDWRKGDQKYYISDTSKFSNATGWLPAISASNGIGILFDWLNGFYGFNVARNQLSRVVQS